MSFTLHPYVTAGIALAGAGVIAVTPAVTSAPDVSGRAVQLTSGDVESEAFHPDNGLVGLIVGGSGTPIPADNDDYVQDADDLYIQRILEGAESHGVFTPEGLSPIYTGVKSLPLDTSVDQGRQMLDSYITSNVDADNTVAVFGESQSSTISGFVMNDLQDDGVADDAVRFSLVGDPSNPDGGLLERFDGASIPSLGITFSGATPPDTPYDTDIYSQEYDGFADFPKYPINFLSDLNAALGLQLVHPTYRDLTDDQLDHAIHLHTTDDYDGNTDYYMIPHGDLPLLEPFKSIPMIGKPLYDLLEPVTRDIVNLGYDNPDPHEGWDAGQANEPTEFGLFPSFDQVEATLNSLGPDLQAGFDNAMDDFTSADMSSDAADLSSPDDGDSTSSLTDTVNGLTAALSDAYSLLLPAADIVNALTTSLPAYDASLFSDNLDSPLDAFGLPLAADTGLLTALAGVAAISVVSTFDDISDDLSGIF
jgi:hypothetical protein